MNIISARRCVPFVLAVSLVAVLAVNCDAGTINAHSVPTITISVEGRAGPSFEFTPAADALEDASQQSGRQLRVPVTFEHILGNTTRVTVDRLEFDPDPFVVNNLLVTNATLSTQTYTVGIALPTSFPAPNIISGSVLTGVIDTGGNGTATVATAAGFPIYTAQIDFADVATLQDHPFSVSVPPGVINSDDASFGPSVSNVAVNANIGIQLRFSLTAGDTATILSRFDVVAIPEPATIALLCLAISAVAFRRWR